MSYEYKAEELGWIIEQMHDYIQECLRVDDMDSIKAYFEEITKTGLFHDSCGKVVSEGDDYVVVTTDY